MYCRPRRDAIGQALFGHAFGSPRKNCKKRFIERSHLGTFLPLHVSIETRSLAMPRCFFTLVLLCVGLNQYGFACSCLVAEPALPRQRVSGFNQPCARQQLSDGIELLRDPQKAGVPASDWNKPNLPSLVCACCKTS